MTRKNFSAEKGKESEVSLYVLKNENYDDLLKNFIDESEKKDSSICFISVRTPHDEIKKLCSNPNIYFIDFLGSTTHSEDLNCVYLSKISEAELSKALKTACMNKKYSHIILDNASTLLHFEQGFEIQKLANSFKTNYQGIKKIILVSQDDDLVQGELKKLMKDLELFADNLIVLD
ncbi:MAG: hypothetical protein ABIJ34_04420 [archaeon]